MDRSIALRQAASRCLHALAELGVLEEKTLGKEKLYVHPRLLRLLGSEIHDYDRYK